MYVPPNVITNDDLIVRLGKPLPETVEDKLGIKARRVTGPELSAADMAYEAGRLALSNAGIAAEDLDLVIVTTDTPEYLTPPTAAVVQGRLKAVNAGAFDINAACSGFAAAVNAACRMIGCGENYQHILLIGVYNMSKYVDQESEFFTAVFGDGSGAIVLSATDTDAGYLASEMWSDGTYHDYFGVFGGGAKYPHTVERFMNKKHLLRIDKPYPPDINTANWPRLVKHALTKANLTLAEVGHLIFTQINRSTIEIVMSELGLPMEKTTCIMDRYGYTGSACLAIALHHAVTEGKIQPGDIIVLLGSGVGAAMAVDILRW
jgi:3-oxoacyl-[acyl-carrier-protein] synthase-3